MEAAQGSFFDKRSYKGQLPQSYSITPPAVDMTVTATLPAYHAYLASSGYSKYTPGYFTADIKRLGQFTDVKTLQVLQTVDLQQWIGELKKTMPAKTVSRKVAALNNYFRWLVGEHVLARNPAEPIQTPRVTSPLPTLLYDNECERLLAAASSDPRTYLLVLLCLETGLKKAELLDLHVGDFDFSNSYQPELWVEAHGQAGVQGPQAEAASTDHPGVRGLRAAVRRHERAVSVHAAADRAALERGGAPGGDTQARDRRHPARSVRGAERETGHEAGRGVR